MPPQAGNLHPTGQGRERRFVARGEAWSAPWVSGRRVAAHRFAVSLYVFQGKGERGSKPARREIAIGCRPASGGPWLGAGRPIHSNLAGTVNGLVASTTNITSWSRLVV